MLIYRLTTMSLSRLFFVSTLLAGLHLATVVCQDPWTTYPIVFEPIQRGRLTIWTGVSTLPASEFKCIVHNSTKGQVMLEFANFANKLEWSFFDLNKGVAHHGISVNHGDDVRFRVHLTNKNLDSYMECNSVENIELVSPSESSHDPKILTSCSDCGQSLLALINNQLRELFKSNLYGQLVENLHWQISQLLTNQVFSGPIALKHNFD